MSGTPAHDNDYLAEALPVFISEAHEQIERLEQLLLQLEGAPDDRELLDALFRCAHTVKGSAGIFGLDRVVAFTHHVETLLDRLREGRIALSPQIGTLLLQCNDQIKALVDAAQDPASTEDGEVVRATLVERLRSASGDPSAPIPAAAAPGAAPAAAAPATHPWHVHVRFGTDVLRIGSEWSVLGTDISDRVLRSASEAIYPAERLRLVSSERLKRYCLRGEGNAEGLVQIRETLRARTRFGQLNLCRPIEPLGPFDAIFLRNVLIYFDLPTKREVVNRVLAQLRPDGLFFVGTADGRVPCDVPLRPLAPGAFRKAAA